MYTYKVNVSYQNIQNPIMAINSDSQYISISNNNINMNTIK